VGVQLAGAGRRQEALPLLNRAVTLRAELEARGAAVPPWVPQEWRLPAVTPRLALRWGQALAVLGDLPAAEEQLREAAGIPEAPLRAEAHLWLSRVLSRQGKEEEADNQLQKVKELDAAAAGQAEAIDGLLAGG